MDMNVSDDLLQSVVVCKPGVIEYILDHLKSKVNYINNLYVVVTSIQIMYRLSISKRQKDQVEMLSSIHCLADSLSNTASIPLLETLS